jgi:hypothetical protein
MSFLAAFVAVSMNVIALEKIAPYEETSNDFHISKLRKIEAAQERQSVGASAETFAMFGRPGVLF